MKVTKTGSTAEVERKAREERLRTIKEEVEKIKNWTKECKCGSCESEFTINVNDIKRAYFASDYTGDFYELSKYGLICPVCGKEYMFSIDELPNTGPGHKYLYDILMQNRVEKYDLSYDSSSGVHKSHVFKRKNRYFK